MIDKNDINDFLNINNQDKILELKKRKYKE